MQLLLSLVTKPPGSACNREDTHSEGGVLGADPYLHDVRVLGVVGVHRLRHHHQRDERPQAEAEHRYYVDTVDIEV